MDVDSGGKDLSAHLADLEAAEDKVVKMLAIAAKVTKALANPTDYPEEELQRDRAEYLDLAKVNFCHW